MPWEKQFDKAEALDKALQAFWSRGYEATSMQDLVNCTGVNRASLYATYGDKRALFLAALHAYDERRRQMLKEAERRYHPREAIRHVFRAFIDDVADAAHGKGCFLTNTALELAAHDPKIAEIVAAAQKDVEAFFARAVKGGKELGDFSPDIKPAEAARSLLATLLGVLVLVRSRPDRTLLQSITADAIRRLE